MHLGHVQTDRRVGHGSAGYVVTAAPDAEQELLLPGQVHDLGHIGCRGWLDNYGRNGRHHAVPDCYGFEPVCIVGEEKPAVKTFLQRLWPADIQDLWLTVDAGDRNLRFRHGVPPEHIL
jgi:hypothetical protein